MTVPDATPEVRLTEAQAATTRCRHGALVADMCVAFERHIAAERPANVTRLPCPTCSGPLRETVGMVCQTCGTDYASPESEVLTVTDRLSAAITADAGRLTACVPRDDLLWLIGAARAMALIRAEAQP